MYRSYVSASGETREVGDETLRVLCGSAGFQATSDAEARQSLARLDGEGARLDPVLVIEHEGTLETTWRGVTRGGDSFDWRIVQEQGLASVGQGRLKVASGPKAASMLRIDEPDMDFVALARGMGVQAERATTAEEFKRLFAEAMSSRGPRLIDALVPTLF